MKYFSMFSGIGGFEYGIQKIIPNAECVGMSEIDKYAIQIYKKHYPETKNYGDAKRIIPEELPDFDLLVGGFPCQSFSIAGKRGGFKDTRGTLFFEIARIVNVKRPELLLLENVKGLLSHDKGRTFGTILSTLSGMGYFLEWQVLNSKNFGVPQNRERVFVIGHFGKKRPRKVFPIEKNVEKFNKSGRQRNDIAHTITNSEKHRGSYVLEEITKNQSQGMRVYDTNGLATSIASQAGGLGAKTGLYAVASRGRHLVDGKRKDVFGAKTQQRLEVRNDKLSNCLSTVEKDNYLTDGIKIRRLTPTECERLQGFPDGWTKGISDTQKYKCLGNAVTTTVIETIITKLF